MLYLSEIWEGKRRVSAVSSVSFTKRADVIVCGLGTAGALAALFSAENSLSVMGIERFTCVGGTHTVGAVPGHYFGCPGGRYEALDEKVKKSFERYTAVATESRKYLTERELAEKGVDLFYEASVCGVYLKDSHTVVGVRVLTQNGILDCEGRIVLDCTADAAVAAMAGCETEAGRALDGQMQPYSIVSLQYNGKKYGFNNVDYGRVNQMNRESLSQAVLFSRSHSMEEATKGKTLIAQMPLVGIREGRRIVPEEKPCLEDLFADRETQTPMFYSYADLDKHGWDIAFDGETMGDWAIGANLGAYNVTVAVPYRAILPKNYEGILVPCRALGVDRDLSSCVRMNIDMKKLAEVAAEWASLAIGENKALREVSYEALKEKLVASGCLKESDRRGYRVDGKKNADGSAFIPEDVHWIEKPELLEKRLQSDKPGQAIWSAKRMGERALPALRRLLQSSCENSAKHAAFALAALGDSAGISILREMVLQRDGMMLRDCRKHNQLRGCMAIYWLGRLADREIVGELIRLISDPLEIQRELYHDGDLLTTRYRISDFNGVYFQFMSQAVMALVRIGERHSDLREEIAIGFRNAFAEENYYQRITARPREGSEGNAVLTLKNVALNAVQSWRGSENA